MWLIFSPRNATMRSTHTGATMRSIHFTPISFFSKSLNSVELYTSPSERKYFLPLMPRSRARNTACTTSSTYTKVMS